MSRIKLSEVSEKSVKTATMSQSSAGYGVVFEVWDAKGGKEFYVMELDEGKVAKAELIDAYSKWSEAAKAVGKQVEYDAAVVEGLRHGHAWGKLTPAQKEASYKKAHAEQGALSK